MHSYGPSRRPPEPVPPRRRRRRQGRMGRFFRGYLMCVGALTTIYVLIQLLVLLFVEAEKWMV